MSAFIKSKLKAARDAISKKDYPSAKLAAEQVLEHDETNYNALVFLGLACLELNQPQEGEAAYQKAIALQSTNPLAHQGLSKLLERTSQWTPYRSSLLRLVEIFADAGDAQRCAEAAQRLLQLARERGTRQELVAALSLLLPTSPFYNTLSLLPPAEPTAPSASAVHDIQLRLLDMLPTLLEVVELTEKEEAEVVRREVEKRRMRLGAGTAEEIRRAVLSEVGENSQLPALYEEVLNHRSTPDDLRREVERKLLRLRLSALSSAPATQKGALREQVLEMSRGQVVLGIPDELAWGVWLEWRDVASVEVSERVGRPEEAKEGGEGQLEQMRRFACTFPTSALGRVIRGYLLYFGVSLAEEEEEAEGEEAAKEGEEDEEEDGYELILESIPSCAESILAHRLLAEVQREEEDWPALISTAEAGLALVRKHEAETGQALPLTSRSLNTQLATALVHLHPPKHHPRALRLLDQVLREEPTSGRALMGRGYVLQAGGKWGEAALVFDKVVGLERARRVGGAQAEVSRPPGAGAQGQETAEADEAEEAAEAGGMTLFELEATEERAWCWFQNGLLPKGTLSLRTSVTLWDSSPLPGVGRQRARAWYRLGRALWAAEEWKEAYGAFITALKRSPTYAPAFTSLAVYYSEVAEPPDPGRASKCFQKAFELDAREGEAARRLAEGFGEEGEWGLVEVVARRVVEGEGEEVGAPGLGGAGRHAGARKYLPQNAWAWKALGAVELQRRGYEQAVHCFQVALRADQGDAGSWLRLGEAYARSGRQVAAIKALTRARELEEAGGEGGGKGSWVGRVLMAEVECEVGRFEEAIEVFESVLLEPGMEGDPGVTSSLVGAWLAFGRGQVEQGYLGRAEGSFWQAVEVARRLVEGESEFRRMGWKGVGDALFELAGVGVFERQEEAREMLAGVEEMLAGSEMGRGAVLGNLLTAGGLTKELGKGTDGMVALKLSLLAAEHRVALTQFDSTGLSSAWFDLAVGLRTLASVLPVMDDKEPYLKESLRCVKEAVRADPRDPAYWNALGVMSFEKSPRMAQHAFLSAIQIDNKDPTTWTNLGLLYLFHEDAELANQAFLRAQTLDPDQPLAWVGQALLAAHNGDEGDASALFEHAVVISSGSMLEASHVFSSRLLNARDMQQSQVRTDRLFLAFSALDRYCRERPTSSTVLHLHALICEQLGQTDLAERRVKEAVTLLEKEYETSEDKAIERRYAIAHANLGRLLVANGQYGEALRAFSTAMNLLPAVIDDADGEVITLRISFALGIGLAHYLSNDLEQALVTLETAQQDVPEAYAEMRGHVTLMLAKVLWALGSEEARETAKSLLLECISADPHNLAAITALASIGSLTGDGDLLTAALAEIDAMPHEQRASVDPSGEVDFLLSTHHLANGDVHLAVAVAEEALAAAPGSLSARQNLASLLLMSGNPLTAREVLPRQSLPGDAHSRRLSALIDLMLKERGELDVDEPGADAQTTDEAEDAVSLKVVEPKDDAKRAVMAAPWQAANWGAAILCSNV